MSSQASSPASPASITEEISTRTIRKLRSIGFALGPATRLTKFIEGLSQKLRNYSSLKTLDDLKEMLRRNKVNGEDITKIKQFTPDSLRGDYYITCINCHRQETHFSRYIHSFAERDVSGEDATGRVDYAIKSLEDLLCITEGKPRNIKIGYAQNLAQLESAFQANKKKRTADQAFGNDYFDYIYGVVTTGTEWHFIIYTPDGIYSTSGSEYQINLTKSAVKDNPELLRSNVKRVIGIIVGLLKDRVSVDSSPTSKRARIEKIIKK
ncbi:hypothetical protein GLOIN_2v1511347 [Rhizophagus irregularis DAOM 181602=DAOM 197198]|nr:hypothetical protein GLOIN_2v1511347 [Rhizophagus irregularis DAOM 181602=DAOM 197198]